MEVQLQSLSGLEQQLEQAIYQKKLALKEECPEKAEEIMDCEARVTFLKNQLKEIHNSQDEVKRTEEMVGNAILRLESLETDTKRQLEDARRPCGQ